MSRSPERAFDRTSPALWFPKNQTPISAVSIPPSKQQNASVIVQRRLPLPICSDRVSSSKWLCGSVETPRTLITPPIGHLIETSAASNHSNGTRLQPLHSALHVKSPDKCPAPFKASGLPNGRIAAAVADNGCYSPPDILQTPSYYASNNTVMDRSQSSPNSVNASQDENLTTDSKSKHKLTKQVIHKVVERERRRKCSEIIMAMKTQFLPDLLLEVSSNSHKSVVPRNILLEYSLAHIVCLQRKCDLLWHALGKEEARSGPRCTMAQPQLDPLRDPSPGLDSRDTPPASSPSSPATRKRVDPEILGNETESQTTYRYLRRSPDFLQPFLSRSSTWQSDVAGEIREFVEKRREAYREPEEIPSRKRKRSLSDETVTAEQY